MSKGTDGNGNSARVVAFASGKGGVGKTVCTANVSLNLARRVRALTVDLDLGCGNLNTSLGVREVPHSINDFIGSGAATLAGVKTKTPLDNLDLVSCSYAPVGNTVLTAAQKRRLIEALRADEAEFVLIDLGAGVGDDVLDLFAAADVKVLVTSPESISLHNAFVFLKSLAFRVIGNQLQKLAVPKKTRDRLLAQLYGMGDQDLLTSIDAMASKGRVPAEAMREALSGLRVWMILNKVQESGEERFAAKLQKLARKNLGITLEYLGEVPFDPNVKKSLNAIMPFALEHETSPANLAFREISRALLKLSPTQTPEIPQFAAVEISPIQKLASLLQETFEAARMQLRSTKKSKVAASGDYQNSVLQLETHLDELRRTQDAGSHTPEIPEQPAAEQSRKGQVEEVMSKNGGSDRERTGSASPARAKEEFIARLQAATTEIIEHLQRTVTEKDSVVASLSGDLQTRDGRIDELELNIAEKNGVIEKLEQSLKDRDGRILGLELDLGDRNQTIGEAQKALELQERAARQTRLNLEGAIAERDERIGKLEEATRTRDLDIESIRIELRDTVTQANSLRSDLQKVRESNAAERERMLGDVAERDIRIARLEEDIRSKDDQSTALMNTLRDRTDLYEKTVSEKEAIIAQLQEDSFKTQKRVETLQEELRQSAQVLQQVQQILQPLQSLANLAGKTPS